MWAVAGLGAGIAFWLGLDGPAQWQGFLCLAAGLALLGFGLVPGRLGRAAGWLGLMLFAGCALIWLRAATVAAPRLDRPQVAEFSARVEQVETLAAKGDVRLTLAPLDPGLPPRVRVSAPEDKMPAGAAAGAVVRVKSRLTGPPSMALPGGHDFARDFWFKGIGATGRALGPVLVAKPVEASGIDGMRARLDRHIRDRLPGSSGTVATAFATGDQNAISEDDADAMRRSGLAHLLSVGGLHITAAVGLAMFLALRILALSPWLALRFNLVIVAAGAGALAGVGYTLLTGSQVPMVRSCVAALLVLGGLVLGREALSMRLVAAGAFIILLFRPEAVGGASFQMSFAAITAIVALHSVPAVGRWFGPREEGRAMRLLRGLGSLLVTGVAVELAVLPLAVFHFHRAGLYGIFANLFAIPWTTFVVMPLEAASLLLDAIGLGGPAWLVTGWAIDALLWVAHWVGGMKGAVASLPSMPVWAFAATVLGGLWLCLWTTRARIWGLVPIAVGALAAALAPTPDVLVSGDGRHLALVDGDGAPALLRDRSGDFIREMMSESAGFDGETLALSEQGFARCGRDSCVADVDRGGRRWRILATRSSQSIAWQDLIAACADADIVVSDRWLPRGCKPRWLKLDRKSLRATGGIAVYLRRGEPRTMTVAERVGRHPWREPGFR